MAQWICLQQRAHPFLLQQQARLRPSEGQPPSNASPTQLLVDKGVSKDVLGCDECGLDISNDSVASCPTCDAGPFHTFCVSRHQCPGPVSVGMGGSLVGPARPAPFASVEDARIGDELLGSLAKMPKFTSLEGAARLFSRLVRENAWRCSSPWYACSRYPRQVQALRACSETVCHGLWDQGHGS